MNLRTRFLPLFGVFLVSLSAFAPAVLAVTSADDSIDNLGDDVIDVLDDVDDEVSDTEVQDLSDSLQELYDDATDAVTDEIDEDLTTGDCSDIENAIENFESDVELVTITINTNLDSGNDADDAYDEMISDLNDKEDELESGYDDLDCSGSIDDDDDTADSDVDTVLDNLDTYLNRLENLQDDIDSITSSTLLTNWGDDIITELENAMDDLEDLDTDITSSEYDDVSAMIDDITSEANDLLQEAEDEIPSSLDDDFTDIEDEVTVSRDDLTDTLDRFDESSGSSSSGSSDYADAIEEIDSALDTLDTLETDDAPDVGSSQTRFDDWQDTMLNALTDVKDVLGGISSLTASQLTNLESKIQDLNDAVDSAMGELEDGITSSLDDDFNDLDDSVNNELSDIDDAFDDITTTGSSTTVTYGSCDSIVDIETELEDLIEEAQDLDTDAEDVNSGSEYDDFVDDIKNAASDLGNIIEDEIDGLNITTTQLLTLSDLIQDVEDELDSAWDTLYDEGSGFTTSEFNDDQDDIEATLDDADETFNDFSDGSSRCLSSSTITTTTTADQSGVFFSTTPPVQRYPDVPTTYEFFQPIEALSAAGFIHGFADGTFKPKNKVTRAEFLKMAANAARVDTSGYIAAASPYTDVSTTHTLRQYVLYAASLGILPPARDCCFAPEQPITRGDAVMALMKIFGFQPLSGTLPFTDIAGTYFEPYVRSAYLRGIIRGYQPSLFGPSLTITRDEASKIVSRAIEIMANQ